MWYAGTFQPFHVPGAGKNCASADIEMERSMYHSAEQFTRNSTFSSCGVRRTGRDPWLGPGRWPREARSDERGETPVLRRRNGRPGGPFIGVERPRVGRNATPSNFLTQQSLSRCHCLLVRLVTRESTCLADNHLIPLVFTGMTSFQVGLARKWDKASRIGRPISKSRAFPRCCAGGRCDYIGIIS